MAAPEVARIAAEMAGKLWCRKWIPREYPALAVGFNVRGIPNFAVFSGGRLVMQQGGAVDHDQMNQWLRAAAAVSA
jgi:thioredoxin 2